jgi:hypothetical protein
MPLPIPDQFFSKIKGLLTTTLRVGTATSQYIEFLNNDNSDYAIVRGKDPVGNNDFVTLGYYNANEGSNLQVVKVAVLESGGTTQTSTFQIPANSVVFRTVVAITAPFTEVGQTIEVGYTGQISKLVNNSDVDVTLAWQNDFPALVTWNATAIEVTVTLATSAAGTGTAEVYVFFAPAALV